ncbi:MAG: cation-translocating P-type ATPase [Chitinophagaceae bacterium]|nr:cation-translocating P-type ATPase [Chitinophagaceae bacterium]
MNWHQLDIDKVLESMGSSKSGLTSKAVESALNKYGPNELEETKKSPAWLQFLNQFKSFMIIVLIVAAIISGIVGDKTDTIIILVIVMLNAFIGFIQEYRAEKAMDALKKIATPSSIVTRDGKNITIHSSEIVPGDIVILEAGVIVPADIRLVESHALRIEESALTGESIAVDKDTKPVAKGESSLGDRVNMAYKGTRITNGRGKGVVTETGMNTEIGKIAKMLQQETSLTPLQVRMEDFGKKLSYMIIGICIILFLIGWLRGEEPFNMLLVSISLAVAAIPEALPALITISLSHGAKRLVKKKALVRKLPAVETLGSVTFICTDKTGTLTKNSMRVQQTKTATENKVEADVPLLAFAMALNHDVSLSNDGKMLGDPMETAIVDFLKEQQSIEAFDIIDSYPRVGEIPFDSDRKCMTTIHEYNDRFVVITKGAIESIAGRLESSDVVDTMKNENIRMASEGMRVIAYGYKFVNEISEPLDQDEIENRLSFAGLVGLIDPPRTEVKDAIVECRSAGIQTVMITGDHSQTAEAIGRQISLFNDGDIKLSGLELGKMDMKAFEEKVERVKIYSRVSPEQKLTIVKALQARDHFVSMTGDGVNDAPSLKAANIGIAMGITGTDVSKEASDMILLDDNFTTIVNAIREGRRIYDNIRKFVKYIMTCNGAEIWTIFLAPILGLPIPLMPIHLLWINLVTDGLPGLALSSEVADRNIMKRAPRSKNESLFAGGTGYHIIWVGILMAGITLGIEAWAQPQKHIHWQTMVFTVLSLAQLGHVFAIRSEREFIFMIGFFSNVPLLLAVIFTLLLQLAAIYLPIGNKLLHTQPLTLNELLICMGGAVVVFMAVEVEKAIKNIVSSSKTRNK